MIFILPESLPLDTWLVEDPSKSKAKKKEAAWFGRGRGTGRRPGRGRRRGGKGKKRKWQFCSRLSGCISSWILFKRTILEVNFCHVWDWRPKAIRVFNRYPLQLCISTSRTLQDSIQICFVADNRDLLRLISNVFPQSVMQLFLQKCEHFVKGSMFYRAELESVNSAVELCSFYCQSNTVNENFCSLKKECWEQENSGFLLKPSNLLRKLLIWLGSKLKVVDSIYGFLASHLLIFRDSMLPIGWRWRQPTPHCGASKRQHKDYVRRIRTRTQQDCRK